ncbi:MAG: SH3 domain-containing protein [Lachnospiraceae bacterium]|nr:SH3 domain-containing protein [Lachnospiraceae bacterium]
MMKYEWMKFKAFLGWFTMFVTVFLVVLFGGYFLAVMLSSATPEDSVVREVVRDFGDSKEGVYYTYGGAHGLPIRQEASNYAKVIKVIPNKTPVEIVSKSTRGFYKIKYNEKIGFVQGMYLLKLNEKPSDELKKHLREDFPIYTVSNCAEYVSLFSKKDTQSKVKGKVYYGCQVRVIELARDGYFKVAYRNRVGYIKEEYLVTSS